MKTEYLNQARLMLRAMPYVAREDCFALKGGTAINFFLWDMPRLSVDIDLTYLPIEPRDESLRKISDALLRISQSIGRDMPNISIRAGRIGGLMTKLVLRNSEGEVKIEPNLVIRGAVGEPVVRSLCRRAQKKFELTASIKTLSEADLFGGKICAALDRQHPRDLFDIKYLFEKRGLTPEIRKTFIVYFISHDRPMHEVIDPNRKDVAAIFKSEFQDMTDEPVSYEELVEAREQLIKRLKADLSVEEKRFLLSVKEGKPDWPLLGMDGIERLPAVQWKLKNIAKMDPAKRQDYIEKLRKKLGL
ncbi:MAG: nucleotidyl transferase AbiEii/AbiGii toxin family protein [Elusimicrobia bacterium]|nr:nucleotidyl transferase AbiEii/AbiGii toxin family protein [Elusimicrobiota bacterium]